MRRSFPDAPILAVTDLNPAGIDIVANICHSGRRRPCRVDGAQTPGVERIVRFADLEK